MNESHNRPVFAFPAVQEHEQVQAILQSLAPLRRRLPERSRRQFETLVRRVLAHIAAYNSVSHLSPMEFILLGFIIELAENLQEPQILDHPPLP
jgi:hypothetical protein